VIPSFSGGRDQEARGSKPAGALNKPGSFTRPYLKKPITKKAGGAAQGEGPEFKPQYHKKKKIKGKGGREETEASLTEQTLTDNTCETLVPLYTGFLFLYHSASFLLAVQ
jgi:hypothetical protein